MSDLEPTASLLPPERQPTGARRARPVAHAFDPAATSAALALGVVSLNANAFPSVPIARPAALLNEWLVWTLGLYLCLVGLTALSERVGHLRGAPPRHSKERW